MVRYRCYDDAVHQTWTDAVHRCQQQQQQLTSLADVHQMISTSLRRQIDTEVTTPASLPTAYQ